MPDMDWDGSPMFWDGQPMVWDPVTPTRAATFYPSATEQDFTATGEVDIRKLSESIGASDNTTIAAFGTGAGSIVLDPYTTRSSFASDTPNLGWALNRDGADGMGVPRAPTDVESAERFIAAGTWTFNARLGASLALTSAYRLHVRVFKVAADGSRSLMIGPVETGDLSPTVSGVNATITTNQSEHTFDEDETLLVSYVIEKRNSTALSESVQFRLNDTLGNDCEIILPAGIRTRYRDTETFSAVGTSTLDPLAAALSRTVNGVGTATMQRQTVAAKTVNVTGVGTVSQAKTITPNAITVNAVGTVTGRIQLPIDELPGGGDFSGSDPTAAITGTVYDENGAIAVGATVLLFRQSDNLFIASDLTDANGVYSFTRDTADPNQYYTVAFASDTSHGTSDRSNDPA